MRIEVEKRKVDIVTLCDVCKIKLTNKNTAWHCRHDTRYGIGVPGSDIGVELSVRIGCYHDQRNLKGVDITGEILKGEIDLCKECHKGIIRQYLDHIEPGSCI